MTGSAFQTLEQAIADEHYPDVDLALRRGRHIGRDDGTAYDYLVLRDAPLLVHDLASRGIWLEQEPIVLDERIVPALESLVR